MANTPTVSPPPTPVSRSAHELASIARREARSCVRLPAAGPSPGGVVPPGRGRRGANPHRSWGDKFSRTHPLRRHDDGFGFARHGHTGPSPSSPAHFRDRCPLLDSLRTGGWRGGGYLSGLQPTLFRPGVILFSIHFLRNLYCLSVCCKTYNVHLTSPPPGTSHLPLPAK